MSGSPYRLAIIEPPRTVAYCPWCRWSDSSAPHQCKAPAYNPSGSEYVWCSKANANGECPHYAVSFLTRLLRRFGWRNP